MIHGSRPAVVLGGTVHPTARTGLREQTGETQPLDRVRPIVDRVIAQRPRMMGVLKASGYESDPLGLRLGESTDLERHYATHTTPYALMAGLELQRLGDKAIAT